MTSRIFPQELIDYIIDFLHDNPDALKNCSLTCRAWLPTCRFHIFCRIYFPPEGRATCQRFHRLLEDVPSIIPLVRDLQITNGGSMWWMQGWPQDSHPWISMEESLLQVLTTLQSAGNLKAFSILLTETWADLHLNLRTSICALLQLPSLTEVDLTGCDLGYVTNLNMLFSHCSGLRRVKLSQISFSYDNLHRFGEKLPHPKHSDRTRLECLTVFDSQTSFIISWVLHPWAAVNATGLRKLRCSVAPSDSTEFSLFERLLEKLRNSLEHLHLQFVHGSIPSTSPCIDVSHHHHLRSLRLSFDIASHLDSLPWVTEFFSQINSDTIHEIVIDLRLEFRDEISPHEPVLSLPWDDLDVALNRSPFRLLQKIDVTIFSRLGHMGYTADRGWAADVKELLPRLASRGILSVYGLVYEKSWFYYWPGPTWHASS